MKDEKIRSINNKKAFFNATLEYISPNQNMKSGFFKKRVKIFLQISYTSNFAC